MLTQPNICRIYRRRMDRDANLARPWIPDVAIDHLQDLRTAGTIDADRAHQA
jgi:hypothetical protein